MDRISALQKRLDKRTAALITSDDNRFYLSGMRSSAGVMLVTCQKAFLLVDFRYFEKAKSTARCEVVLLNKLYEQLAALCIDNGVTRLLCETDTMDVMSFSAYKERLSPIELSDSNELTKALKELRSIKSEQEIKAIKEAQRLTDLTFSHILNFIRTGRTEREVMLEMEFFMRRAGSEGVSFDFIVVSGKNSALPHGVPTEKVIEKGDFVTMDFGAVVDGYRSDMTRTVAVGVAGDEQKRVYETVLTAQKKALDGIKAGVECIEIDRLARDFIYSSGYEGCFGHGTGHSVGIAIHEDPAFNLRCRTVLQKNMIMTVEPGIYLEGKFGVRIEDMVVVTENGCENITQSEKKLIVL